MTEIPRLSFSLKPLKSILQIGLRTLPFGSLAGLLELCFLVIVFSNGYAEDTKIPVNFKKGWNLISLPAVPIDSNPQSLFEGIVTDPIWTQNQGRFEIAAEISSGHGYWVFSRNESSFAINVNPPEEKEISLFGDRWNLVPAFNRNSVPVNAMGSIFWKWQNDHFQALTRHDSLHPLNGYYVFGLVDASARLKTENIPPVANTGAEQSVAVGSFAMLSGVSSVDANGHPLTFLWNFLSTPNGSSAIFSDPSSMNPTFFVDLPGSYIVQLVVNDGVVDSNPNTTIIAIDTSKPTIIDLNRVEPNPNVLSRIYGSTGDGRAGVPVTGGFDCDGDQLLDTAFSAIKANPLDRNGAGEVVLIFGDGTIGGEQDTAGFQRGFLKVAGVQPFEVAGAEIWMDDVTGDGLGDLLICRQNYTPTSGREGAGALTVIVGAPELRTYASTLKYFDLAAPPQNIDVITFSGVHAYDRLGIWARTGDITGDGIADIVVGSDEVDGETAENQGAVYVIRGGSHLATSQFVDLINFGTTSLAGNLARIIPPSNSPRFHFGATCQIADLDGNGRGEVLMSAALNRSGAGIRLPGAPPGTGQSSGGSSRGTLFVAWDDNFHSSSWPTGYEFDISSPTFGTRTIIEGADFNRSFGEEILGGFDYDDDKTADLFVGDLVGNAGNGNRSGSGHIFFKANNLRDRVFSMQSPPEDIEFSLIKGPTAGAIGADTAAHGDFNADGIGDLIVGNPHDNPHERSNAGTMHVLLGQTKRWPDVIDLSNDQLPSPEIMQIVRIDGAHGNRNNDAGDTLCYSASAADLDGDGYTDIIVNEMAGNGLAPQSTDVGNLLLISGAVLFDNGSN